MVRQRLRRREMPTKSYPARTVQNVKDSDGTVWFGTTDTPGAKTTLEACKRLRKPVMLVKPMPSFLRLTWSNGSAEIQGSSTLTSRGIGSRRIPALGKGSSGS